MRLPTFTVAASSGLIGLASALASEGVPYAFHETTVGNLVAEPADECFYDVTIPALLDEGFVKYAWVPWSKLSNESLAIAPHGAFVYKTTNDTLVYEALSSPSIRLMPPSFLDSENPSVPLLRHLTISRLVKSTAPLMTK